MIQVAATVTVNLRGVENFKRALRPGSAATSKVLDLWAVRYRAAMQRRFNRFSRGGGDWRPLAPSTIKRRRKGRGSRRASILRDTGLLFNALSPAFVKAPGQYQRKSGFSVTVGYGGGDRHLRSRASIAQIASFHQIGAGRLPRRQILAAPDSATMRGFVKDVQTVFRRVDK